MSNTKKKFAFWLTPKTKELVERSYQLDNSQSQSEFIEKAIKYYAGYLSADKNKLVLGEQIQKLVESSVKSSERRISNQTFRIAVELAKLQMINALYSQIDEKTL